MILWIFALLMLGLLGMVGFYQGAIRAGFSFVGLIVAAALAVPLSHLISPILKLVGLTHPITLAFIGSLVAFLVVLTIFKIVGFNVHRKIDGYYKYQDSDTRRLLFEHLNQRVGICVGVMNATVYLFLIAIVFYILGYFTVQAATSPKDPFTMKLVNKITEDVTSTRFDKALAPFVMAKPQYYDAADALGDVLHNPVLESRLASYPPFLPLLDRQEFKDLGNDLKFQEFWLGGPTFTQVKSNPKLGPMLDNVELYTNVVALLKGDFGDLKTYLETGKSEKFGDEKIIGRWDLDFPGSMAQARKAKANITTVELRWLSRTFRSLSNATFVAYIDNKARLKLPMTNGVQTLQGNWQNNGGDAYTLSFSDGKRKAEFPAKVEGNKLAVSKDNLTMVFEK